ncbi:MAG: methylmalonyl Co-A mutase-associated GTPase MeaB [Anaerolineaceae bacterium]
MIDLDAVTSGNRLVLSRLLTEVENDTDAGQAALDRLFVHAGRAHLVGITGAPGTGKSSLVSCLARHIRAERGKSVAVVAVDPSSPFTGGAILGDRVRMRDLAGDAGVFIRSMASRGALGGLARATAGVVQVLDAAGFDFVLVETVGAGQSEVDIARLAHTTLVIEAPGLGDDIQAIKAGILEIADILVINKADLPGVDNTERALRANLDLGYTPRALHNSAHMIPASEGEAIAQGWVPPVLKTIATQSIGMANLLASIEAHRDHLQATGLWQQRDRERLQAEVAHLVQSTLVQRWQHRISEDRYKAILEQVYARVLSPGAAIEILLDEWNHL